MRPRRSVSTPTETLSIESRLTAVLRRTGSSPGSGMTSLASPGWLSCKAPSAHGGAGESQRRAKERRRVDGRFPEAHTTTIRRIPVGKPCGRRSGSERVQVAPLVGFIEGVLVIGAVAVVDRCSAAASEQRGKRSVKQRSVVVLWIRLPRLGQETSWTVALTLDRAMASLWHASARGQAMGPREDSSA
jgi:hypothetical protein